MNYDLENSLVIAEMLIAAIEKGTESDEMLLKLEATLKCFQFHIKTLTGGLQWIMETY